MLVRELSIEERNEYDALAWQFGSPFSTARWAALFGTRARCYGIYENGVLCGGFLLYKERKWGVRCLVTPPITPNVGPFFVAFASSDHPRANLERERKIAELLAGFLSSQNAPVVSVCFSETLRDMRPFLWIGFKVSPQYSYVLNLEQSLDEMWSGFSSKVRNDIRRAERDGIRVENSSDWSIVYEMICDLAEHRKLPIDVQTTARILNSFADETNSFDLVAYSEGKIIASLFCVRNQNTCYMLFLNRDFRASQRGATSLLVWRALAYAKEIGLQWFDFEGSMLPSVERYFRGFGGELRTYFRVSKAFLPLEMALKLGHRELF